MAEQSTDPTISMAMISGDGTGLELIREVRRVVDWFVDRRGLRVRIDEPLFGRAAFERHGTLLTQRDLDALRDYDMVFFGAAGGPNYDPIYDDLTREQRDTGSLIRIRQALGTFANLRPIRPMSASRDISPLRPERLDGVDMLIVRELLGGAYLGEPRGVQALADGDRRAINTHVYLASQVRAVAEVAFTQARQRRGRVCSVEKAAVMEAGQMWREEVEAVHSAYPDIILEHMAIDTCAQLIIQDPGRFDVIVTDNMFGDILSDVASAIVGSVGYQASACLNAARPNGMQQGLYEPLDANDFHLNGKNLCNPVGAVLCFAQALTITFGRPDYASLLEFAVDAALATGLRTIDVVADGNQPATTSDIGDAILDQLDRAAAAR